MFSERLPRRGQKIFQCTHVPALCEVRMYRLKDSSAYYEIVAPGPIAFGFYPTNKAIYLTCAACKAGILEN